MEISAKTAKDIQSLTVLYIYMHIYIYIYICMYMFITPVFVYVNIAFIFECIYLGIEFRNEHVFCSDHMIMYIYRKKKKVQKKK